MYKKSVLAAFGTEYAQRSGWSRSQRLFIKIFGMVDLPTRIRARCVRRVLQSDLCDRILDFGSGTGVYAFYFTRQPRCQALAVDVDVERVEDIEHIASSLGRHQVTAVAGDESILSSLPKDSFSAVLAIESLQYSRDVQNALAAFYDCLRDGGVLVAHVPLRDSLWLHEQLLFNDRLLYEIVERSGLQLVCYRQTFGPLARKLCAIYSLCARWSLMLPVVYPFLLLLVSILPPFVRAGNSRLIVARKAC